MNKLILLALLVPSLVFADDGKSYSAKINENGKFCARVDVTTVANIKTSKRYCRSLDEWRDAGYLVTPPVEMDFSQSKKNLGEFAS